LALLVVELHLHGVCLDRWDARIFFEQLRLNLLQRDHSWGSILHVLHFGHLAVVSAVSVFGVVVQESSSAITVGS
jgi:hypothetical protein